MSNKMPERKFYIFTTGTSQELNPRYDDDDDDDYGDEKSSKHVSGCFLSKIKSNNKVTCETFRNTVSPRLTKILIKKFQ